MHFGFFSVAIVSELCSFLINKAISHKPIRNNKLRKPFAKDSSYREPQKTDFLDVKSIITHHKNDW